MKYECSTFVDKLILITISDLTKCLHTKFRIEELYNY